MIDLEKYETGIFYKKCFVVFDEDMDERILDLIDNLPDEDINDIVTIGEHEGTLSILWKNESNNYLPSLRDMKEINIYDGRRWNDLWGINHEYFS